MTSRARKAETELANPKAAKKMKLESTFCNLGNRAKYDEAIERLCKTRSIVKTHDHAQCEKAIKTNADFCALAPDHLFNAMTKRNIRIEDVQSFLADGVLSETLRYRLSVLTRDVGEHFDVYVTGYMYWLNGKPSYIYEFSNDNIKKGLIDLGVSVEGLKFL